MPALPEAVGIIVCNAGPLIALAGIQQLPVLERLYTRVMVAEAVFRELTPGCRRVSGAHRPLKAPSNGTSGLNSVGANAMVRA
jgi:hypothetical protein